MAPAAQGNAAPVFIPIMNAPADADRPTPAAMRSLPELPQKSPDAEVKQRVGITTFTVTYSSPAAKGRTIWGELVPHDKLWRTGANAPTKLIASREFTFGGKKVPAGSYTIISMPTATAWTVLLNKDPKNRGAFEHKPQHDVARLQVTPTAAPPRERLAFMFEDTSDEGTNLVLDWAGKRVVLPIGVDTKTHIDQSIAATLDNAWRPLFNAGRHHLDAGETDKALGLFEKSIGIQATWWNHWWMAQALAKKNQYGPAREHAQKAQTMGAQDDVFKRAFAEDVKKALESWPKG